MDLAYWGFRRWPFDRSFAADRYFANPSHEEALARLMFLVEESRRAGFVIGPAGSGKTFLLKLLQQRAERIGCLAVRTDATGLDGYELISEIANGCLADFADNASAAQIWNRLQKRFAAMALVQQPLVVVIDHFDQVEVPSQQVVSRLGQIADSLGVKLTIIVAIRDHVIPAVLRDVVELRIDISPWNTVETLRFINAQVTSAGCKQVLFTEEAIELIHSATGGIAASIVSLCNLTLLAARGQDKTLVTRPIVEAACRELMPLSATPLFRQSTTDDRPLYSVLAR